MDFPCDRDIMETNAIFGHRFNSIDYPLMTLSERYNGKQLYIFKLALATHACKSSQTQCVSIDMQHHLGYVHRNREPLHAVQYYYNSEVYSHKTTQQKC